MGNFFLNNAEYTTQRNFAKNDFHVFYKPNENGFSKYFVKFVTLSKAF